MENGEASGKLLRLRCAVQNYDWGRRGEESMAARLFARNTEAQIDPVKPYAEFWIGTHESGPSLVAGYGETAPAETLKSWISRNPRVLGDKIVDRWGSDLPFLFKVLSVAKALSIQAHPDKELAMALHRAHPSLYKDANHKPEMAVALTNFKALCGFVALKELKDVLISVPEIQELVGIEDTNKIMNIQEHDGQKEQKAILQSTFTKLMSASNDAISELVPKLKNRLETENKIRKLTEKEELVLLLENQYPGDIGVISAFFFNYVKLSPGEALCLGANEPHSYISGECIECMATSDNVVRAGLTPKYRDIQTLCSMLTYKMGFPEILKGVALNPYVSRYMPPFDEFEVDRCFIPVGKSVVFSAVTGPSVFLVVAGEGMVHRDSASEDKVEEGHVFFAPAETEIRINAGAGAGGELQLYRAGVNTRIFG